MIPPGESDRGGQPLSSTGAPSHARIVAEIAQLENVGTRRSRVEAETLRWVLGHYPNSPMDDRRKRAMSVLQQNEARAAAERAPERTEA
jgi:hypothetical protein